MLTASHLISKTTPVLVVQAEQLFPLNHVGSGDRASIGCFVLGERLQAGALPATMRDNKIFWYQLGASRA